MSFKILILKNSLILIIYEKNSKYLFSFNLFSSFHTQLNMCFHLDTGLKEMLSILEGHVQWDSAQFSWLSSWSRIAFSDAQGNTTQSACWSGFQPSWDSPSCESITKDGVFSVTEGTCQALGVSPTSCHFLYTSRILVHLFLMYVSLTIFFSYLLMTKLRRKINCLSPKLQTPACSLSPSRNMFPFRTKKFFFDYSYNFILLLFWGNTQ